MATAGYPGFGKVKPVGAASDLPVYLRKAAVRGRKTINRARASRAVKYAAGKGKVIGGGADWYKKTLGVSKGAVSNIGLGVMLALMVKGMFTKEQQFQQTAGMQNIQAEHLRQVGGMGADQYYAAALPELQAERQMAQQALMQMIGGGQGIPLQVPGERVIGGARGGGGFGGY